MQQLQRATFWPGVRVVAKMADFAIGTCFAPRGTLKRLYGEQERGKSGKD
jgi:hypothetical protein